MKKEVLENLVNTIFQKLGTNAAYELQEEDAGILLSVTGNDLNHLIGYRGEVLNALQHFLTVGYFNDAGEFLRIAVDINGYRDQRKAKLEEMTRNFIDRVRFFSQEVEMPSMSPMERRIVHVFVSGYDDIVSESVGIGRDRRVVLKPNKL